MVYRQVFSAGGVFTDVGRKAGSDFYRMTGDVTLQKIDWLIFIKTMVMRNGHETKWTNKEKFDPMLTAIQAGYKDDDTSDKLTRDPERAKYRFFIEEVSAIREEKRYRWGVFPVCAMVLVVVMLLLFLFVFT